MEFNLKWLLNSMTPNLPDLKPNFSKNQNRLLEHLTVVLTREQHGDGRIHQVRRGKLDMRYTDRSKYPASYHSLNKK